MPVTPERRQEIRFAQQLANGHRIRPNPFFTFSRIPYNLVSVPDSFHTPKKTLVLSSLRKSFLSEFILNTLDASIHKTS